MTKVEIKFDDEGNIRAIVAEDSENSLSYVLNQIAKQKAEIEKNDTVVVVENFRGDLK